MVRTTGFVIVFLAAGFLAAIAGGNFGACSAVAANRTGVAAVSIPTPIKVTTDLRNLRRVTFILEVIRLTLLILQ
jgi:hypothetical protein